uniref:S100/CaBP-9k-type calcium binding subdomain domain-containing protein n=1 Tax=Neogobius melanostomus TaxID=47308 RepID=A0A8C6SAA8_9GOBI
MACKSRVSDAIATLVGVFHEYASKDCEEDHFKLSKSELKELMQKELDMDNVKDPAKLDELMKELDEDGDGQVDFLDAFFSPFFFFFLDPEDSLHGE